MTDILTRQQRSVLRECLLNRAGWLTARNGRNHHMLQRWQDFGWVKEAPVPGGLDAAGLVNFEFTELGRDVLEEEAGAKE